MKSEVVEKKESKFKLFTENFLVYGVGGIISKIIPLIMVPIVTRMMPNSTYYGISDMSNTVLSFTSAIAVMGMYDAMYRMFFEKDDEGYKKEVCSTAFEFTLITSVIVFLLMLVFERPIAKFFFSDYKYANVVYITAMATLIGGTNTIISAPTRMQNQRKIFLITNTLGPVISYGIAIPLLLRGYYIIALPLSALISNGVMELSFWILNRSWFHFTKIDKKLLKQLLVIAIPLFPNFLIYWVFNSSDRVMITNLMNIGASGIYSVGSKLGHASQLIYTAFAGGWQYFAFSTMKEDDQVESNSRIFEYLGIISFITTTFICAWSYGIYKLLFTGEYVEGFIVAPYLFLAPLLQMLFQVIANQFIVVKKTWPNLFILSSGAVVNIILNFVMIPTIGIEGAAIASLIGYCVSDIICTIVLLKMKLMVISGRFIWASILMTVYFFIWRWLFSRRVGLATLLAIVFSVIFVYLYKNEASQLLGKIRKNKP